MRSSPHTPWVIDHQYLDCPLTEQGKWRSQSLPWSAQHHEFLSVHICKDISCTVSACQFPQDYHSRIVYRQPTTLLVFGVEGTSQFEFINSGLTCIVRPGDVWLLNTAADQLLRTTQANVLSRMTVIKYATDRINQTFHHQNEQPISRHGSQITRLGFGLSPDEWLTGLVKNPMHTAADRLLAEARTLELLAHWLTPPEKPEMSKEETMLKPVLDMLRLDLVKPPSLEALAKQAGMSHTRLNRQFRALYGVTVFEWLRQYRLERAKNYLQAPELAITDIAYNCGFSSNSHFTQTFKSHFGVTPTEYRRRSSL